VRTGEVVPMTAFVTQVSHAGHYLHWGVISISVTNAAIVALMVVVFVAAILLPLGPQEHEPDREDPS
jgi:hypothetical protein